MQSDCQLILNVADMLQPSYESILIEEKEYVVFMGTMTISKFMNLNIIYNCGHIGQGSSHAYSHV